MLDKVLRGSSVCLMLAVTACGPSFEAATPQGFIELEEEHSAYDYRATTPDGLVIAVREIDNESEGAVSFWAQAVENEMRFRGGYALLGTSDVTAAGGLSGKQLRFGHDEGQKPHLYYIHLFATADTVYLLEVGGTKEQVERHAAQIDWAVQNFAAQ